METPSIPSVKAISIGPAFVGKTALLLQIRTGRFDSDTEATLGCYCFQKTMKKDGKNITLTIWDTAGQERFNSITQLYYKGTSIAMCVFDLTRKSSLDSLVTYIDKLLIECYGRLPPSIIIIGNKADLREEREVSHEEVMEVVSKYENSIYIETSAKLGTGLDELNNALLDSAVKRVIMTQDTEESSSRQEFSLDTDTEVKKRCC